MGFTFFFVSSLSWFGQFVCFPWPCLTPLVLITFWEIPCNEVKAFRQTCKPELVKPIDDQFPIICIDVLETLTLSPSESKNGVGVKYNFACFTANDIKANKLPLETEPVARNNRFSR